jgi:hypothetical protein
MSLDITAGSRSITSLGPLKDLASSVKSDFRLGPEIESQLDKPLSTMPANLRSVGVDGSGSPSWTAGAFSFSLTAGAAGKLSVMLGGDTLLNYADKFETDISIGPAMSSDPPAPAKVTVPSGIAYVCVELQFQIGGGISATAPVGTVGIQASVSTQNSFTVAFYRKCSPSDTLHDAIGAAFTNYVLPLHPLTFSNLDVGDYLHHDFNASLEVGLGASIGYSKVFYAGQSPVDIPHAGAAVTLDTSFIPSLQASATLSFSFVYTGCFEVLLWKDDVNTGHLHLYRSKEQDTSLGLNLGIGLRSDPATSASNMSHQLGSLLGKSLPGSLGSAFTKHVLPKAMGEIANYASDGSDKIAGWLGPINDAQARLDVAIQKTKQTFLLLDYTFDLAAQAFPDAWKTAVAGDFVKALGTPNGGVSIAVGGGLEKFYCDKTSISLNLFGQLKAAWSDAVISNSSMVYAGNNTFHLMANEGRQLLWSISNSKREIDIYFAAEADFSGTDVKLGTVSLHYILQAANNQKYGGYIANFLGLMTTGPDHDALVQSVRAIAARPKTTQSLHLTFDPAAYGRLQSSTLTNGKPDDQTSDQQNYAAFAKACSDMIIESPANFSYNGQSLSYSTWSNWNIASNDQWPPSPSSLPNRTQSGSSSSGLVYLGQEFPQSGHAAQLIGYALHAGSDFMNLCADLKSLVTFTAAGPQLAPWDDLVARLKSIINNDVSQDFIAPTTLALTRLCAGGSPPSEIVGPPAGLTDKNSIAVTITYS